MQLKYYINNVLSEPPKHVLGARIGAHFTLLSLGAAPRGTAIAQFSLGNSLKTTVNVKIKLKLVQHVDETLTKA